MAKVEIDDVAADQAKAEAEQAAAEGAQAPEEPEAPAADAEADAVEPDGAESDAEPEADEGDAADADKEANADDVDAVMQAAAEALKKAQAEAADWQDKYLRLHAEWDTYRRRTNEQREAERARATEKLVENLLPVIDDFERTIDYAEKNGEQGLLSGVQAVHTKFVDVLVRDGVEVIDPAGDPFDALECQAVSTVDDAEAFDETVRDVYQKGYKMGKKVLRPAMVTVTTGGPKRPKEDPDGTDENEA